MPILAGIDEAGYGPVLGPLVVTGVVFDVPQGVLHDCLWRTLQASVTRRIVGSDRRLPVADSKKLYRGKKAFSRLERTALVMAGAAGITPRTQRELLGAVAPHAVGELDDYPWYRDCDQPLPAANDPLDLTLHTNAVRKDLKDRGIRLEAVYSEPLLEGRFNRLVRRTRNKAAVSLGLTLRIVQRIVSAAGGRRVHVLVDRQGGRQRYGPALMTAFDQRHLEIIAETSARSAYRLEHRSGPDTIEFVTSGEDHHLPIALASILSKYQRELFMIAFNRYWAGKVADVKPTAGYYRDAMRFLADIGPVMAATRTERDLLVRQR